MLFACKTVKCFVSEDVHLLGCYLVVHTLSHFDVNEGVCVCVYIYISKHLTWVLYQFFLEISTF